MSVRGRLRRVARWTGVVGMTSPCGVGQLEQIMDGANHRPLASDLVETPQQELPEASGLLDVSEYRLDDLLVQAVATAPASTLELGCHGGLARPFWPLSRSRSMLLAVAGAGS
jgi:hypothetical protein